MPQLDALRAMAVGAVMYQHYALARWGGDFGVKLFFTLSGFLITGILLQSRSGVERGAQSWGAAMRKFYARRVLRIFPLYYAVILTALVVDLPPARDIAIPLLSYTLNFRMAAQGWYENNFAHFWSLAVEEQYYVVWPWLVLLVPRRRLALCAIAMAAVSPVYRLSWVLSGYMNMTSLSAYISTWTCLDTIGLGSLLAVVTQTSRFDRAAINRALFAGVLPVALGAALALAWWNSLWVSIVFYPVAQGLVFCALIWAAAQGLPGLAGRILQWRPLTYLGKISYGLYVYHPLMPALCLAVAERAGWHLARAGWDRSGRHNNHRRAGLAVLGSARGPDQQLEAPLPRPGLKPVERSPRRTCSEIKRPSRYLHLLQALETGGILRRAGS